jgi:hypothetical protein
MLRRAVAQALGELLGEPVVQNMNDDMRAAIGPLLAIELEVAAGPTPIIARTFQQAGRQLDPGMHGIALRRHRTWELIFPAQFRATNTAAEAHHQFLALATNLGLPALQLDELAKQHRVGAYLFNTITLVQSEPTSEPMVVVRGEPIVSIDDVTPANVRNWAEAVARHLSSSLVGVTLPVPDVLVDSTGEAPAIEAAQPVGVSGTYNPIADDYRPLFAPPDEQAIAALALSRASRSTAISAELREKCAGVADKVLADLTESTTIEKDPFAEAGTCAIILVTLADQDIVDDATALSLTTSSLERLQRAFLAERTFEESLAPHERAMIAWAVVRLSNRDPLTYPPSVADKAIDDAWNSVEAPNRIALLPWIGWAESERASVPDANLGHGEALRELLEGVCASRMHEADRNNAGDLTGGLALSSGSRHLVTAQSLRPFSWLAGAVRDARLVPDALRADRIDDLRIMLRFVRQLMAREETTFRYRNNVRSIGGIREATWDLRQPVPAQALGLITLLDAFETLQSSIPEQP